MRASFSVHLFTLSAPGCLVGNLRCFQTLGLWWEVLVLTPVWWIGRCYRWVPPELEVWVCLGSSGRCMVLISGASFPPSGCICRSLLKHVESWGEALSAPGCSEQEGLQLSVTHPGSVLPFPLLKPHSGFSALPVQLLDFLARGCGCSFLFCFHPLLFFLLCDSEMMFF